MTQKMDLAIEGELWAISYWLIKIFFCVRQLSSSHMIVDKKKYNPFEPQVLMDIVIKITSSGQVRL